MALIGRRNLTPFHGKHKGAIGRKTSLNESEAMLFLDKDSSDSLRSSREKIWFGGTCSIIFKVLEPILIWMGQLT